MFAGKKKVMPNGRVLFITFASSSFHREEDIPAAAFFSSSRWPIMNHCLVFSTCAIKNGADVLSDAFAGHISHAH